MVNRVYQKRELIDAVKSKKDKFDTVHDTYSIVDAAIIYGVYLAIGGKKVIPLPPFTDSICSLSKRLAIIKNKSNNIITIENLQKINNSLHDYNIELYSIDNCNTVYINIAGLRYHIRINSDINLLLVEIWKLIMLQRMDEIKIPVTMAKDTMYRLLLNLGRN